MLRRLQEIIAFKITFGALNLHTSWQWPEDQPPALHAGENLTETSQQPPGAERGGDDSVE